MFGKTILFLLSFTVFCIVFSNVAKAINNPNETPNNRYGIHITDANDLKSAADLVNSSGGDWGYVTFVIREDDRNLKKWQDIFDIMREIHLIPIVRLATKTSGENWEKFDSYEVDGWVYFLNSLNWVVQNRYIIIGNEPNHAKEWGGEINPYEYSNLYTEFAKKLKEASPDFFMMPAGLDASAPNTNNHMGETEFITKMLNTNPEIYDLVDGLASHSYPNPNFSGSEFDVGPGTIATYDWELEFLKSHGITKDLPVFITETGWAKTVGNDKWSSETEIAEKIVYAYENVWNDKRIVAVTPFILDYKEPLFEMFSWKTKEAGNTVFYEKTKSLPKTPGEPVQKNSGQIVHAIVPQVIFGNKTQELIVLIENSGQSIWGNHKLNLIINSTKNKTENLAQNVSFENSIKPYQKGYIKATFNPEFEENEFNGIAQVFIGNDPVGTPSNFHIYKIEDIKSFYEYIIYLKDSLAGWFIKNAKLTSL
jgi:hypothetical protein